jgi:hypothetical protein
MHGGYPPLLCPEGYPLPPNPEKFMPTPPPAWEGGWRETPPPLGRIRPPLIILEWGARDWSIRMNHPAMDRPGTRAIVHGSHFRGGGLPADPPSHSGKNLLQPPHLPWGEVSAELPSGPGRDTDARRRSVSGRVPLAGDEGGGGLGGYPPAWAGDSEIVGGGTRDARFSQSPQGRPLKLT